MIKVIITYSIKIFPDIGHFSPCDTEILSDDTGEEREKVSVDEPAEGSLMKIGRLPAVSQCLR